MKKTIRHEIAVGLFILAAAAILGYTSLKITGIRVRDGFDAHFVFDHLSGLVEDAAVTCAGVEIGYVKDISLHEGKALITARIRNAAGLKRNIHAAIRMKSLLGEAYLDLTPGEGIAPPLTNGDTVTNTSTPPQIDQLISWAGRCAALLPPEDAARLFRLLSEDPGRLSRILRNSDILLQKGASLDAGTLETFIEHLNINVDLF